MSGYGSPWRGGGFGCGLSYRPGFIAKGGGCGNGRNSVAWGGLTLPVAPLPSAKTGEGV